MKGTIPASIFLLQALIVIVAFHGSRCNSADDYMTINFQIIVKCGNTSSDLIPKITFMLNSQNSEEQRFTGQGVFNNYCQNRFPYYPLASMTWMLVQGADSCCWSVTGFQLIRNSMTLCNDLNVETIGDFFECNQTRWLCSVKNEQLFTVELRHCPNPSQQTDLPRNDTSGFCSTIDVVDVTEASSASSSSVSCVSSSTVKTDILTSVSSSSHTPTSSYISSSDELISSSTPFPTHFSSTSVKEVTISQLASSTSISSFYSSKEITSSYVPHSLSISSTDKVTHTQTENFQSPSPSPSSMPQPNTYPADCFRESVEATRMCLEGGMWNDAICSNSAAFMAVINKTDSESLLDCLEELEVLLANPTSQITVSQGAYLLFYIYSAQLNSTQELVSSEFSESFIEAGSELVDITENLSTDELRSAGSLLLWTLNQFGLDLHNPNQTVVESENIVLSVQEVQQPQEPVISIMTRGCSIVLPTEIFNTTGLVKIASFYYSNLSVLLQPEGGNDSVASPVISSTIDCDECQTQQLDTNVTITFTLPQENLPRDSERYNDSLFCVYWKFAEVGEKDPPTDRWSRSGCSMTSREGLVAVCECNHLTHFAILLSPGVEISSTNEKILTTLGYILIPVSLLCLILTMITYIPFRSLWSMRSYVHVMLCGNMFAAQLLFVVGVERTENEHVCAGISIVLLYLFLVTFMWMLMEGVVLYVALVRVFVTFTTRYLVAFTVASYGIPALYLAAVVPIGLTINGGNNFLHIDGSGDLRACWLNYRTHFIWVFITPVVAIIFVNIGFLIMSVIIMCRHQKSEPDRTKLMEARYWIRAILSLVVVMGIAWIFNILFFIEQLIFVAYIMTAFIAGQGLIIFVLFVVLSKQAREAYLRWWQRKKEQSEILSKLSWSTKSTGTPIIATSKDKNDESFIGSNSYVIANSGAGCDIPKGVNGEISESILDSYKEDLAN